MYFIDIPHFDAERPEAVGSENSLARPRVVAKALPGVSAGESKLLRREVMQLGTQRTFWHVRFLVAVGGKTDIGSTSQNDANDPRRTSQALHDPPAKR